MTPEARTAAPTSAGTNTLETVLAEVEREISRNRDEDPKTIGDIERVLAELSPSNSQAVVLYGTKAQRKLAAVAERMLDAVKTTSTEPAGAALSNLIGTLKKFRIEDLDTNWEPGFFGKMFGAKSPLEKLLLRYHEIRREIETITIALEKHKTRLLTDVITLDKLYESTLDYFHALELYLRGGEEKLTSLRENELPALEMDAGGDAMKLQRLADLRRLIEALERRLHDLKLSRTVTMQNLPTVRMIQQNGRDLIGRINSTLDNTIPLWRNQLAQALRLYNEGRAAKSLAAAGATAETVFERNVEKLSDLNSEARDMLKKGGFDKEAIAAANAALISAVEESLALVEATRAQQKAAIDEP